MRPAGDETILYTDFVSHHTFTEIHSVGSRDMWTFSRSSIWRHCRLYGSQGTEILITRSHLLQNWQLVGPFTPTVVSPCVVMTNITVLVVLLAHVVSYFYYYMTVFSITMTSCRDRWAIYGIHSVAMWLAITCTVKYTLLRAWIDSDPV